ncbi:MAG: metal-dependent hydrolase [Bergeyella sp.]|nr:metal-dependent hydrolase [Bergeyella sp.]
MRITFLGQNCFFVEYEGVNILTDPFYNYQKDHSGFEIRSQVVDYLLITHAHEDHIADVNEVLNHHPNVVIIGQPELCSYFGHAHVLDINFGGHVEIKDLKITMVPALHTSSFPDGGYGGAASGYVFSFQGKNIYLAGDTGMMADMSYFKDFFGEITLSILPVGGHYTMGPKEAAFAASELLKTKKVVGCHFDTFPPIRIDHEEAYKVFREKEIDLMLPKAGEKFEI